MRFKRKINIKRGSDKMLKEIGNFVTGLGIVTGTILVVGFVLLGIIVIGILIPIIIVFLPILLMASVVILAVALVILVIYCIGKEGKKLFK